MPLPTLENSIILINGQADHCYVSEEDMALFYSIHETKINNDLNINSLSQVEVFY